MSSSVASHVFFCCLLCLVLLLDMSVDAEPAAKPKETTNSIGMKLVLIPSGKFTMGSPQDEKDRKKDEPQHEVTITRPFYLGMYTVTVGQFRQFVKDAGYKTEAEKDDEGGWGYNAATKLFVMSKKFTWQNVGWEQTDDHPVVNVTWNDGVAFCEWLSKKEGQKYQLPTEAQWEYSCRAGTTTRFYSGDEEKTLKGFANMADASFKRKWQYSDWAVAWDDGYAFTAPVGKFKPNAFGLFDMHGNAWQWCADWYGEYPQGAVTDPQGPNDGKSRVFRGGSFDHDAMNLRCACRNKDVPSFRFGNVGFRVAKTLAAE